MSNSTPDDLQERERINATFKSFTDLESWTPAMGALLVSGLVPVGRPISIHAGDGSICSVRNPAVAATEQEFEWAQKVLYEWLDCQIGDEGGSAWIRTLKAEIKPSDFLRWSMENYAGMIGYYSPPWLNYILTWLEWKQQPGVPLPAPSRLGTRAAAIEKLVPLIGAERAQPDSVSRTTSPEDAIYVEKMSACIRKDARPNSGISKEIIEALRRSEKPGNMGSVWDQLCEMSESGNYRALQFEGKGKFSIDGVKGAREIYEKSRLNQFLKRYKLRAGYLASYGVK